MRHTPPPPLIALVFVAVIIGIAWTIVVAPLQQPDEPQHMARIQRTAEGGMISPTPKQDWSTQQLQFAGQINTLGMPGLATVKMPWDPATDEAYRAGELAVSQGQRGDADALTTADGNPPLFYDFARLPYALGGSYATRLWTMRLSMLLWFAVTVAGVWLLAGEAFRRDRQLQIVAAGAVTMQPLVGSISSAVSPDGMFIAMSTLTLWLALRVLRVGFHPPTAVGLLVMLLATSLVKTVGYGLVPAVLLTAGFAALRARRPTVQLGAGQVATLTLGLFALLGAALFLLRPALAAISPQLSTAVSNAPSIKRFGSYVWQWYLGHADFLTPTPNLGLTSRFKLTWIQQVWGSYGLLDAQLSSAIITLILWAGVGLIMLAVIWAWRHRSSVDAPTVAVLVVAVLGLLAGLHLTEYNLLISLTSGPILQGRYLLPLVGIGGLVAAAAVGALPKTARSVGSGTLLGALLTLDLIAMDTALVRFYAV